MAFILVPKNGEDIQINAWNWRPTLELLRAEGLISDENYERMGSQGCGGRVDGQVAHRIAELIDQKLAGMKAEDRLLPDLTVMSSPKPRVVFSPTTKPDDIAPLDIYSASYQWLVIFRDFCNRSGGFEVF